MLPELGVSSPASNPSSVDLPEPDTPTTATASPAWMSKLTSERMVNPDAPMLTCLVSALARTMGPDAVSVMFSRWIVLLIVALAPGVSWSATILIFGDSLSAGYGLAQGDAWPILLERRLLAEKPDYKVVNASISGETTLGGLNRIDGVLRAHRPDIIVIALGANDGLRGQSLDAMRRQLEAIVDAARKAKARPILVGMRLPPNYGKAYTEKFQQTYVDIAKAKRLPLVPFLLDGFAEKPEWFQPDGIHPTREAQPRMLDSVWRVLKPQLRG